MPVYEYRALNAAGKTVTGVLDADSPSDARARLRAQRIFPVEIREGGEEGALTREVRISRIVHRFGRRQLAVFTRQLATLIRAGLPIVQSLNALIEQAEDSPSRKMLARIREEVNEGSPLADALAQFPKAFSGLYVNMVRAGEAAGALEVILERLAEYAEKSVALRNRIRAALIYPLIMTVIGFGVMVFLMTFVVPMLRGLLEQVGSDLPPLTVLLLGASDFLKGWWWALLIALVLLLFGGRFYKRTRQGKRLCDRVALRIPLFGKLVQKIAVARFCRTLAIMAASGIPILSSMEIVKRLVNNMLLTEAIDEAKDSIAKGASIAEPLKESGLFPPIVIHMVSVGEATGQLEQMLENVADAYDQEVEATVTALTSILEPIIIVVMGAVVLVIVLSILLPILDLTTAIQQ